MQNAAWARNPNDQGRAGLLPGLRLERMLEMIGQSLSFLQGEADPKSLKNFWSRMALS